MLFIRKSFSTYMISFVCIWQVDKLEQSENVRSEEEEKAVEQPIVFGM